MVNFPCSVGVKVPFSIVTYSLKDKVEMVAAYVEGRPIPFSSINLTMRASVYLEGALVKCCSCFSSIKDKDSVETRSFSFENIVIATQF